MKKQLFYATLLMTSISISAQSIKDLDFLIGEWEVLETIYPGTDKEYQEKGIRICEYYLNGSFIKCESSTVVSTSGKERFYAYVINYDKREDCFRATNLANDFPLQGQFKWFLDKENKQILAITPKNVIEDRFFRATISYANPNKLVWNGWRSKWLEDKEWKQVFNDVATRKN